MWIWDSYNREPEQEEMEASESMEHPVCYQPDSFRRGGNVVVLSYKGQLRNNSICLSNNNKGKK